MLAAVNSVVLGRAHFISIEEAYIERLLCGLSFNRCPVYLTRNTQKKKRSIFDRKHTALILKLELICTFNC